MLFLIDHELTLSEVQEWIGQRYVTNKKGKKKNLYFPEEKKIKIWTLLWQKLNIKNVFPREQ